MKIPRLFLHDTLTDWFHALFFQGECIGSETLSVYWYYPTTLDIPEGAQYAHIIVEASDSATDKTKVIRFWEDGSYPNAYNGMPLGDLGTYEVKGKENMQRFKMIGIQAYNMHQVQVQYFA